MTTGVYFIEGYYLYTLVGSSGRGVLTSEKGATGVPSGVPVCVRMTLGKGSAAEGKIDLCA